MKKDIEKLRKAYYDAWTASDRAWQKYSIAYDKYIDAQEAYRDALNKKDGQNGRKRR
jgi:hypothetical protein